MMGNPEGGRFARPQTKATMPTYEYLCRRGHEFELFQRMSDPPADQCPRCGADASRKISGGAGFLFRGEGFYITDHRSEGYRKAAKAENAAAQGSKAERTKAENGKTESGKAERTKAENGRGAKNGSGRKRRSKDGSRDASASSRGERAGSSESGGGSGPGD